MSGGGSCSQSTIRSPEINLRREYTSLITLSLCYIITKEVNRETEKDKDLSAFRRTPTPHNKGK
ncbi:unnamed protein product [Brassica oleracea var. botrytis]